MHGCMPCNYFPSQDVYIKEPEGMLFNEKKEVFFFIVAFHVYLKKIGSACFLHFYE